MFEDNFPKFYPQDGEGELTVPVGWRVDWIQGVKPGELVRPECKPDDVRVVEGKYSAKMAHAYSFFIATLYRRIQIPNNTSFTFTAQAMYISNDGGMGQVLGVDLAGEEDFRSPRVQWGEWLGANEGWDGADWRELSFSGKSLGNYITLFLRADCRFAVQTNAAFFDHVVVDWAGAPSPGGDTRFWKIMADNLKQWATDIEDAL